MLTQIHSQDNNCFQKLFSFFAPINSNISASVLSIDVAISFRNKFNSFRNNAFCKGIAVAQQDLQAKIAILITGINDVPCTSAIKHNNPQVITSCGLKVEDGAVVSLVNTMNITLSPVMQAKKQILPKH